MLEVLVGALGAGAPLADFRTSLSPRVALDVELSAMGEGEEVIPGSPERRATEAALMAEYERHEHVLLPPEVLGAIRHAAQGRSGPRFLKTLESVRFELFDAAETMEDAIAIRTRRRVEALSLGARGVLSEVQVTVAEAVTDVMLLQRASLEDIRRAEATCGEEPRCLVIERLDDAMDLVFETMLPVIVRPEPIVRAIPEADVERIRIYAQGRPDHAPAGIFSSLWRPVTVAPVPAPEEVPPPPASKPLLMPPPTPRKAAPVPPPVPPPPPPPPPGKEYNRIRAALAARVVGHDDAVDRLALASLLHGRGARLQRILLCGPSGTGKTHLARAVAETAGCAYHLVDASSVVETGYRGMNLSETLDGLERAARGDQAAMERAVIFADELDKLRIPGVGGVSDEKRAGQQYALLTLLGGGTPVGHDDGRGQIATDRMLIVCAGAFSDAPWSGVREPNTQELVEYGFLPELAERLTERIVLRPRSAGRLVELFRTSEHGVATLQEVFTEAGYKLIVTDETFWYVARAVAVDKPGMGPRTGNGALLRAARQLLIRALRSELPAGSELTLTPDDIVLPRGGGPSI